MQPNNGQEISASVVFEAGTYLLPDGLNISADNITIDGNGATILGAGAGLGISAENHQNITIKNLTVKGYQHNIHIKNCQDIQILDCVLRDSAEIAPNTIFLDIFVSAENNHGSAIMFNNVAGGLVAGNDLQHQLNGLSAYNCRDLTVRENVANHCSGFGFHLNHTCDSVYSDNSADFCCRYNQREKGGHLGADAAGFVIVNASCGNQFLRNAARMGGDGFFLAGLTHNAELRGCDNNLFEGNDGSYSPNIAFEATFSRGNIYRNNKANSCNYGFWLGFSAENHLSNNQIFDNRRAGIAVENGIDMQVLDNQFRRNRYGILLWSKYVERFREPVPDNDTSRNWLISNNQFVDNNTAIRIAANQDHGIRPMSADTPKTPPPTNHQIDNNNFSENQQNIELVEIES